MPDRFSRLLAIAIVGVVLSIYYYFGWIKAVYFVTSATAKPSQAEAQPTRAAVGGPMVAMLASLALISVFLGFYQAPLMAWIATLHY